MLVDPNLRPPPCEGELSTPSDQAREDDDPSTSRYSDATWAVTEHSRGRWLSNYCSKMGRSALCHLRAPSQPSVRQAREPWHARSPLLIVMPPFLGEMKERCHGEHSIP